MDIEIIVAGLALIGILGGWAIRTGKWLMDIKNGVTDLHQMLTELKGDIRSLKQSDSELWQHIAWLKGKLDEPLERSK